MPIRILIVDNHPVVRAGLEKIVATQPNLELVGEATCCESGCAEIDRAKPDLVIFDINLDDNCGAAAIGKFRDRFPDLPAILFTEYTQRDIVVAALKKRIQGFVAKSSPVERLLQALTAVSGGQPYLDPEISPALIASYANDGTEPFSGIDLSTRQMAVLRLLAEGLSNKEIARDLFITESTVKFHVSAILQVLEARNRAHAVRIAESRGWIQRERAPWQPARQQFAH